MNQKLFEQIKSFIEKVGYYLKEEYRDSYYKQFSASDDQLFDFIGSYYMGGSTVPETARYVVDYINIKLD